MLNNQILSKESSESEIKAYFNAVLKLSQSANEFPVNLDEAWPLVYSEKSKAVRALRDNFIEDVDFITIAQNGEGGRFASTDYYLTLSCMEFFIARKVRSVFEVYRQVFHKTANKSLLLQFVNHPANNDQYYDNDSRHRPAAYFYLHPLPDCQPLFDFNRVWYSDSICSVYI